MSISKRILFERHSEDDAARAKIKKSNGDYAAKFTFRLPRRRKGADGRWDVAWMWHLDKAADQLGLEYVNINDGMFFETEANRKAVVQRAKELEASYEERTRQHNERWRRLFRD